MQVKKKAINSDRLLSLDALRGFDMFWIIGGHKNIYGLAVLTGWPLLLSLNSQMRHVGWEGFAFYDLIFPLFLFLSGVSMPYSFGKGYYAETLKQVFIGMPLGLKKVVVFLCCNWLESYHYLFGST